MLFDLLSDLGLLPFLPCASGAPGAQTRTAASSHDPTSFAVMPMTFSAGGMPPMASARKWTNIAADAARQAAELETQIDNLSGIVQNKVALMSSLNNLAETAAIASQKATAAAISHEHGMTVAGIATPVQ